jgi:hypothetical protein
LNSWVCGAVDKCLGIMPVGNWGAQLLAFYAQTKHT